MPLTPWIRHLCFLCLLVAVMPLAGGCNILGAVAAKAPKPDIPAAYKGLERQTVGVMVWVEPSMMLDWSNLQLDLANSIDHKIRTAQTSKAEGLEGASFPYQPRSFIRYQKEHPGLDALPITEVAPKLGVNRLVYVEVNSFSTRAEGAIAMYLGTIDVNLKVIEVDGGQSRVGYEESGIRVQYPRKSPREGEFNKTDRGMYIGVIDEISTDVATRFFKHPDDSR